MLFRVAGKDSGNNLDLLTGIGIGLAVAGTYAYLTKAAETSSPSSSAKSFKPVVVVDGKESGGAGSTDTKSRAIVRERRDRFSVQTNRGDDVGYQCR